jgi:D-alanyl-lipoteichoic acid acyltransferase DltB (MBOAT superfamily)
MLFNSIEFLLIFLPLCLAGFYWFNGRGRQQGGVAFLAAASLAFFAYWDTRYLLLLGGSMAWNWGVSQQLMKRQSRRLLILGIAGDLITLGYFKYANFFVDTAEKLSGANLHWTQVVLPVGISFFTFTQIAFLVDAHRGEVKERGGLNYILFVTFFPHLIAGPILHHKEMIPQFAQIQGKRPDGRMVGNGLFLLITGLFKKIVIADNISKYVDPVFANVQSMEILDAWTATLGYTLQLYFDFSAYSEMAMGIALLFGIKLPMNFCSPYRAKDISDFWKRWHMTLSRFLRDYVYIPMGGSRKGFMRTLLTLWLTMLIGGIWHGAGWTFIAWGAMHGTMLVMHRWWKSRGLRMPDWIGQGLTMFCVAMAWVVFRAHSIQDAVLLWRKMFGLDGVVLPAAFRGFETAGVKVVLSPVITGIEILYLFVLLAFCMSQHNVHEVWESMTLPKRRHVIALTSMAAVAMFYVNATSSFQYFNF